MAKNRLVVSQLWSSILSAVLNNSFFRAFLVDFKSLKINLYFGDLFIKKTATSLEYHILIKDILQNWPF